MLWDQMSCQRNAGRHLEGALGWNLVHVSVGELYRSCSFINSKITHLSCSLCFLFFLCCWHCSNRLDNIILKVTCKFSRRKTSGPLGLKILHYLLSPEMILSQKQSFAVPFKLSQDCFIYLFIYLPPPPPPPHTHIYAHTYFLKPRLFDRCPAINAAWSTCHFPHRRP